MKHHLLTTIAAVLLVGCGESQQSAPAPEAKPDEPVAEVAQPTTPPKAVKANKGADPARGINPKPSTTKATDISIHDAAYDGNIEAVKQHFAAGTDLNAKNKYGLAPLHYAANKEIAELLIAEDANVNAKDDNGSTPLHGVAVGGSKEIAELLIAKGADVNAKQKAGGTPLDLAIQFKEPEIADLLRKHGGKHGTIHGAAAGGDTEAVKGFLAAGADVNARDMDGKTPLDRAIQLNRTEIADLLRKHGGKTGEELEAADN